MAKLLFWIMLDYTLILQQVNLLKIYFFFFLLNLFPGS